MLSLTDQDGRNEAKVVLKEFEVLDGHPTSWVDYVNKIIGVNRIPDDEVVIVKNPEYFKKLSAIMKRTDARTVSNYLMWRAVRSKMKDLNHEASLLKDRFDEFEIGTISAPPTPCPKVPLKSNVVVFSAISGRILKPFDLQVATLGRFDMMYDMP